MTGLGLGSVSTVHRRLQLLQRTAPARFLSRLSRNAFVLPAVLFLVAVVVVAGVADYIAPHDPNQQDLNKRFIPPVWQTGGTSQHLLGTDHLGRDVLSRVLVGARLSLVIGAAGAAIGALIGVPLGLLSGYFRGWLGELIMRLADMQMSIPGLLLIFTVVGVTGPSVPLLVLLLGLATWMLFARLVRSQTLSLAQSQFVEAARVIGNSDLRIICYHILPNVVPLIITMLILELAPLILAEASVSFLGLGVQPPDIAWGLMLAEGRQYITVAWWVSLFPGLALFLTVLSLTIFANWLRIETDPLQRRWML